MLPTEALLSPREPAMHSYARRWNLKMHRCQGPGSAPSPQADPAMMDAGDNAGSYLNRNVAVGTELTSHIKVEQRRENSSWDATEVDDEAADEGEWTMPLDDEMEVLGSTKKAGNDTHAKKSAETSTLRYFVQDGVKRYPCNRCQKTYSRPSTLRRHLRLCGFRPRGFVAHGGGHGATPPTANSTKPMFACFVCGKSFNRKDNMMVHRKRCQLLRTTEDGGRGDARAAQQTTSGVAADRQPKEEDEGNWGIMSLPSVLPRRVTKAAPEGSTQAVPKPSLMMASRRKGSILEDSLGKDLVDAGRFCFGCENIFANRKCFQEHPCPGANHICSCGTEFIEYVDMLAHSGTHEPGHEGLDHVAIKKRRIEQRIEQLDRLQTGEVVWKTGESYLPAKHTLPIRPSETKVPTQSMRISQVPPLQSKDPLPPNPNPKDMQDVFAGVSAPTVDLWTLYQPVVLVRTTQTFNKTMPYTCAKCGQGFITRASLISHHSSHVIDKVAGCIGCGLLLSSKKLVPRIHVCKAPNTPTTKSRIITAKPLSLKLPNVAVIGAKSPTAQGSWSASYLQLKNQKLSAASQGSRSPLMTSTLQLQNQKFGAYNKSKLGLHISPSLQGRSQKPNASSLYITNPLPSMSRSPNPRVFNKSSRGLSVAPSGQFRVSTQSLSGLQSKPMPISIGSSGFPCRVCHLPFETAQMLQRHKCVKAKEFMANHVRGSNPNYRLKRVTPLPSLNSAQMNGERKYRVPVSGNINKNPGAAVNLDKVQGAVPPTGKTGMNKDDDCYIVESGPDKSAEMIYQMTSSVPIKT
ncbi:hypothetical protein EYF80_021470 [Liparis tanakae]|uniref:C2H2-type domain-containing protein n=1 Tax=Liparis tanakae TaxID=230148 RepID=A0A4Z2HRF4_9TELE|nr:hypothetical protein EYF80_021470 [Liparis tanakae]